MVCMGLPPGLNCVAWEPGATQPLRPLFHGVIPGAKRWPFCLPSFKNRPATCVLKYCGDFLSPTLMACW